MDPPAQDRGRGDDQPHPGEAVDRQHPSKQSEPVRSGHVSRAGARGRSRRTTASRWRSSRISASFHQSSLRDNPSSDMTLDTIRKISFKPTSRRSSHVRTCQGRLCRRSTRDRARQSICPGDTGFRHLQRKAVTGYRDPGAGYRRATDAECVIRPCVMVVWVAAQQRRRGVARDLARVAARQAGVTTSGLAWAEPFTDRGYLLAQSVSSDGLWIVDYS